MITLKNEGSSTYKHTDMGLFPLDWEIFNLPDVIWFQEGPGLRKWQFKTRGLKVINVTNLQENGFLDLDRTDRHISWEEFEKTYKHFACDDGDLVIASSGNSYCKVSIVRACDLPLLMNTSVIRFKPLGTFSKSYMDVYLKSKYFKDQIDLMITGGAQPNFGPAHLSLVKIPAPVCEHEQTAIANALSDVDALIQELEKLIAKKQAIKTATMQQLLTGRTRLPQFAHHPDGRKKGYKPSELGEIPEDWIKNKLGNIAPLQRGFDLPSTARCDGQYPVVYSNGIVNTHNKYQVKGPGVVTGRSGTLGKVHYIEQDYWPHNTSLWVTKFNQCDPKFIFFLFSFIGFERFASGSGVPTLNRNDAHCFELTLPSTVDEQIAISTILTDMDKEIQSLDQRLSKTRQIKQGMMQELLTGKTRLIQRSETI